MRFLSVLPIFCFAWMLVATGARAQGPCTSVLPLTCGTPTTVTLSGSGNWANNFCVFSVPGNEQLYTFTPSVTGTYSITVSSATENTFINYGFKPVSFGCTDGGFQCIQDVITPSTTGSFMLTAGVAYYFLLDSESSFLSETQTFSLNCPPSPCNSISPLQCGATATFNLSGAGFWNVPACGSPTPGSERVYSFTPSYTGAYSIRATAANAAVNYFFKPTSASCADTGWTCIGQITTPSAVGSVNLVAGTQYLILADAASATGTANHTFLVEPTRPTVSYIPVEYCSNGANPTPTIVGNTGGTFSAPAGVAINPTTGVINLAASNPGIHVITYNLPCMVWDTALVILTSPAFNYAQSAYCVDDTNPTPTITGTAGGAFSGSVGLSLNATTGAIDIAATTPGTHTVTYTVAGCAEIDTLTISTLDSAALAYANPSICQNAANPQLPTFTGTLGGVFTSTTGLAIDSLTGAINPAASTAGDYVVTYTSSGACPATDTAAVSILPGQTASIAYVPDSMCQSLGTSAAPTITGVQGGTFSSTAGLSLSATSGVLNLGNSLPGTYTVTYATTGLCPANATDVVAVLGPDNASFAYDSASFCLQNPINPEPTIAGLPGGMFSATTGLSLDPATGEIDLANSTPGNHSVAYMTTGPCPDADTVQVEIRANCSLVNVAEALASQMGIRLYPNPAKGMFFIEALNGSQTLSYTVTDLAGRRVLQGNVQTAPGAPAQVAAALPQGTYIVTLNNGHAASSLRLVVSQ